MLDYLKKAFWAGPTVTGLGRVPVNALATLGCSILGVGHPAFWLLGLGLEAGYLAMVATDSRFQRWVDRQAQRAAIAAVPDAAPLRQELVQGLSGENLERFTAMEQKHERVARLARESGAGAFEVESAREALGRLSWIHLKLLVARQHLESSLDHAGSSGLKGKIGQLETEVASSGNDPAALRKSREATLEILRQRLRNLEQCEATLRQVNSDLARVEAQVDLALESATAKGSGAVVAADLELASQTLKDGLDFGASEAAILALDEAYAAPARMREPTR